MTGSADKNIDQIIDACKEGKEWGQKMLYTSYKDALYNLAFQISGSETEAEHILQDSFLDIFRSIINFRGDSGIYAWMRAIVVRKAIKNKKRNHWEWTNYEEAFKQEEIVAAPETDAEDLMKALHQLPDGYRTILILFYMEDYTHEQIANELGIETGTSKSQLHRAKLKLKKIILKGKK